MNRGGVEAVKNSMKAMTWVLLFAAAVSVRAEVLHQEDFNSGYGTGNLVGQHGWVGQSGKPSPQIASLGGGNWAAEGKGPSQDAWAYLNLGALGLSRADRLVIELTISRGVTNSAAGSGILFGVGVPGLFPSAIGASNEGVYIRAGISPTTFCVKADGTNWGDQNNTPPDYEEDSEIIVLRSVWNLRDGTGTLAVKNLTLGETAFTPLYFDAAQQQATASIGDVSEVESWAQILMRVGGNSNAKVHAMSLVKEPGAALRLYGEDFESGYTSAPLAGQNGWAGEAGKVSPVVGSFGANGWAVAGQAPSADAWGRLEIGDLGLIPTDTLVLEMTLQRGITNSAAGSSVDFGLAVAGEFPATVGATDSGVRIRADISTNTYAVKADGTNWGDQNNTPPDYAEAVDRIVLRSEWDLLAGTGNLAVKNLALGETAFTPLYFDAAQQQASAPIGNVFSARDWSEVVVRLGGSAEAKILNMDISKKPNLFPLTAAQQAHLVSVVQAWRYPYDSVFRLLKIGAKHPLRWSLEYAVTLLDSGTDEYRDRALDVLNMVLPQQDINPNSNTYGLWAESLEDFLAGADENSADFNALSLIRIRFVHGNRLPAAMVQRIDTAIYHAAQKIKSRTVYPSYTNIALLGTLVTLASGEFYGWEDVRVRGMEKLQEFYDYTQAQGSFAEYNSPNYAFVSLDALLEMQDYVREDSALVMVDELYATFWAHVAVRSHPPTRQWSGPHSRSYQDILPEDVLATIDSALAEELVYTSNLSLYRAAFEHRLQHRIPENLKHYFTQLTEPRQVVETFEKPADPAFPDIVGTTWVAANLSLGSINRCQMWNQRRNLQAYWGGSSNPGYLRLRFLKNNYDFSAVQFFGMQERQRVAGALNFSTNGGDTHLSHDRIQNERFTASDLRLRFEFGGAGSSAQITVPASLDGAATVTVNGLQFEIKAPVAVLDGMTGYWESGSNTGKAWLDLVLYDGVSREFHLPSVGAAAIGFALRVETGDGETVPPMAGFAANETNGLLTVQWDNLLMKIPSIPATENELQAAVEWPRSGLFFRILTTDQ